MQTPEVISAQTLELIKVGLSIVGFLIGVVSIFLVYLQMRKTHEWNRRKASHDTLNEFVTGHIAETLRILVLDFSMEPSTSQTYTDAEAKLTDDEARRKMQYHTVQLLNYIEALCIGMKNSILDENICYDHSRIIVKQSWLWAEPLVKARRQATGIAALWIEVENISKRWSKREERESEQHIERLRVPGKRPT
ncbi:MAG: hypothetical protein QOG71_4040 [Pyrinomonadaceae bacterium]|nr:hypothetical protein [Pyrinomonadaceae bacterium]